MSWDICIQEIPGDIGSLDDIPNDFRPRPLGLRSEVIARIKQTLPQADFSNPSWGVLDQPGFSIEFSMGSADVCDGFTLHVRGGGVAVATIARLLDHLKLRGIDLQIPDFFSPEAAEASFRDWQAYRDRVIHPESSKNSTDD